MSGVKEVGCSGATSELRTYYCPLTSLLCEQSGDWLLSVNRSDES